MKKNAPLYEIIDELGKENFNSSEVGKIFVGSILEVPRDYFISKYSYIPEQSKTKKKRQFMSSLKRNMMDGNVHQKYIGMSAENLRVLFDYRAIRADRTSIEGIVYEILSEDNIFDDCGFSGIRDLAYKGSKEYSEQESIVKRGKGSFRDREYNAILESLRNYVSQYVD